MKEPKDLQRKTFQSFGTTIEQVLFLVFINLMGQIMKRILKVTQETVMVQLTT